MSEASEEQAREVILDSIADGVFTVDGEWNITSFNRAAEQITGVVREEAIGQKCFDVFHANICETACALRETMESGRQRVDRRINILNNRGEKTPVSISTAVLRNEQGEVIGGVETFRDLSSVELLRREIHQRYTFRDIISKNHEIRRILGILPDIATSNSTVLIEGPTGTGKELFAKAIHSLSARARRKYVAVNCGALPDTLLESELFGYRKGAFTDAHKDKPGRFERAEGGTLFLDEIGDVSTALQVKLLRVLQEREYEPLGGTSTTKTDVRVIGATNKPLAELVARGSFREDLYYRLNVLKITLPPLSHRREDIPLLVDHFVRKFNAQQGKQIEGISEEALGVLMNYEFPGNVRQLQNVIEHAVVLCRGERIEIECLPAELLQETSDDKGSESRSTGSPLLEAEASTIFQTLRQHDGHRGKTAVALGIDKSTLWRKMKKYGITYS
ncbi:MAG: sigma 54-interacting transcriptional regulator [Candidatus Nealsonbacteria bacterium]|nr:sigma 54-interacting transcriptional regulator [Candidatus Nealsonbacteria bacterium]